MNGQPQASAPPRVLYVDDDEALCHLVSKHLGRNGFVVETETRGGQVMGRLTSGTFDVVALDHFMPDMIGVDLLPEIRSLPDPPPVIYVTGMEDARVAVTALKAGAIDYVIKDVEGHFFELLAKSIDQAIEFENSRRAKTLAEQEMRIARERAELLLEEVNHRVGNSLNLVASFVRLQASLLTDPGARTALEETQSRIMAISQVHRALNTSVDVRAIAMESYLRDLISDLNASLPTDGAKVNISLTCEPITVSVDKAISMGVLVAELVTNAIKYAYPAGGSGSVRVALEYCEKAPGAESICLSVADDGVGWTADQKPKGTGLGSRIMTAMTQRLDAKFTIERDQGTKALFVFPR